MSFLNLMGNKLKPKEVNEVLEELTNAVNQLNNIVSSFQTPTASSVTYNNTSSGLTADDVQNAIDEVNTKIGNLTDYQIVHLSKSVTVSANATVNFNPIVDLSSDIPTGYTVVGVVGFSLNNAQLFPINISFSDSSWGVGIRNISTGEQTSEINLTVLCIKTRN